MNKNIPHPAGVFKYALGNTPESLRATADLARETRRDMAKRLIRANNAAPITEPELLRAIDCCTRLELVARTVADSAAAEGGRA